MTKEQALERIALIKQDYKYLLQDSSENYDNNAIEYNLMALNVAEECIKKVMDQNDN